MKIKFYESYTGGKMDAQYGEEWEKDMMKMPKKELINWIRVLLIRTKGTSDKSLIEAMKEAK